MTLFHVSFLQVRSSEWIGFSCQALVPPSEPPLNCSHVVFVPKQPNTLFSEHLYKLSGLLMLAPLLDSVGESKDLKMDLDVGSLKYKGGESVLPCEF